MPLEGDVEKVGYGVIFTRLRELCEASES